MVLLPAPIAKWSSPRGPPVLSRPTLATLKSSMIAPNDSAATQSATVKTFINIFICQLLRLQSSALARGLDLHSIHYLEQMKRNFYEAPT